MNTTHFQEHVRYHDALDSLEAKLRAEAVEAAAIPDEVGVREVTAYIVSWHAPKGRRSCTGPIDKEHADRVMAEKKAEGFSPTIRTVTILETIYGTEA